MSLETILLDLKKNLIKKTQSMNSFLVVLSSALFLGQCKFGISLSMAIDDKSSPAHIIQQSLSFAMVR